MSQTQPPLTHIGFILDGNRRWAKANGQSGLEGHKQGYKVLKQIAQACFDRNIEYFSCYLFSTENWTRAKEEVSYLMDLALRSILKEAQELHRKNVRLRIIGSRDKLSKKLLVAIEKAEKLTANNTAGTFLACFNYGGKEEIVNAVKKIVESGVDKAKVNEDLIKQNLYTAGVPPIDLVIRTSGEYRISNFMLWDCAYAELSFVDKYWPDFNEGDLELVLSDYIERTRRFGK